MNRKNYSELLTSTSTAIKQTKFTTQGFCAALQFVGYYRLMVLQEMWLAIIGICLARCFSISL